MEGEANHARRRQAAEGERSRGQAAAMPVVTPATGGVSHNSGDGGVSVVKHGRELVFAIDPSTKELRVLWGEAKDAFGFAFCLQTLAIRDESCCTSSAHTLVDRDARSDQPDAGRMSRRVVGDRSVVQTSRKRIPAAPKAKIGQRLTCGLYNIK